MRHRKLDNYRHAALKALDRFEIGDRVEYPERGWVGTVKSKSEESAWIYCVFDGGGLAGCDPRRLVPVIEAKGDIPTLKP